MLVYTILVNLNNFKYSWKAVKILYLNNVYKLICDCLQHKKNLNLYVHSRSAKGASYIFRQMNSKHCWSLQTYCVDL